MKTKEKNNILKIVLIVVGVLVLGGVLFFLFGSGSEDVLTYYDDGKLKSNYSVNSEGWVFKYYVKENNLTDLRENFDKIEEEADEVDLTLNGEGKYIVYYGNGNKAAESGGFFTDEKLTDGEIIFYNENGNKKSEEKGTFKDGKLNGEGEYFYYFEDGKIRNYGHGTFTGGNLNGEGRLIIYDENGDKSQEQIGTFKLHKLVEGNIYDYDEDGRYTATRV